MKKKLLLAMVAFPVLLIGLRIAYMAWDNAADDARSKAEHDARIESLTTALTDADETWATDKQAAMDQYVALLNEKDCAKILGTKLTRAYSRTVAFAVETGDKATARTLASAAYRLDFALSVDSDSAKRFLNDFDRENTSITDVSQELANADAHWEQGQLDLAGPLYLTTATKESQLQQMLGMNEGVFYPLTQRQRNELEAFVAQLATALPRTYSRAIQYAVSQNDTATAERLAFKVLDKELTLSPAVSDVTSILNTARPKWNALRRKRDNSAWAVDEVQRADSLWNSGETVEAGHIYLALINVKEDDHSIVAVVERKLPAAWARVYSRAVDFSADSGDEATAIQIIERVNRNLWYTLSLTSKKAQQLAITRASDSIASTGSARPEPTPVKPPVAVVSGKTFQVTHVNGNAQLEVVVSDTVAEEITFTSFEWTRRGLQFKGEIKSRRKWKCSVYRANSDRPHRRTLDYEKESIFSDKITGRILVIGDDATRVVIHH